MKNDISKLLLYIEVNDRTYIFKFKRVFLKQER